jgi:hypothetical protein
LSSEGAIISCREIKECRKRKETLYSFLRSLSATFFGGKEGVYIHTRKHIVRPRELVSHIPFRTKKYVSFSNNKNKLCLLLVFLVRLVGAL